MADDLHLDCLSSDTEPEDEDEDVTVVTIARSAISKTDTVTFCNLLLYRTRTFLGCGLTAVKNTLKVLSVLARAALLTWTRISLKLSKFLDKMRPLFKLEYLYNGLR